MKVTKILTLAVLPLLLLACGKQKVKQPLSADDLQKYQVCQTDADCVYANNGCCDCANGGQAIAVNKALLDKFQQLFDCDLVACTLMAAVPPCDAGLASCQDQVCVYVRDKL